MAAALLLLAGCDGDGAEREGVGATRVLPMTVEPIPQGAIPRGWLERQAALAGPGASGPEAVARGRERFGIYCAPCHGAGGHGDGVVTRHGFTAPPSFHDPALRAVEEAHIVGVITHGIGRMLPYADRVEPADRWAVAAYVKALQRGAAEPAESAIYLPAREVRE